MYNIPIDIAIVIITSLPSIKDIMTMSLVSKKFNAICQRDDFWKILFDKKVDKKYIIEPHLMKKDCWKTAFFKNMSVINPPGIYRFWSIFKGYSARPEYPLAPPFSPRYSRPNYEKVYKSCESYVYIEKKDYSGKTILYPILIEHSFSLPSDTIISTDFGSREWYRNGVYMNFSETQVIIMYPYHHYLVVNNHKIQNIYTDYITHQPSCGFSRSLDFFLTVDGASCLNERNILLQYIFSKPGITVTTCFSMFKAGYTTLLSDSNDNECCIYKSF